MARGTYETGQAAHQPVSWLYFDVGDEDDTRNARAAAARHAREQSRLTPGTDWTVTRAAAGTRAEVARYRNGELVT